MNFRIKNLGAKNKEGDIGGLLNLKQSGADYSYVYDGKGSVAAVLNTSQAAVATYHYNEFGALLSTSGTIDQPFRFSTQPYDPQTGLSYYGYRFYAPPIGRWLNRDPIGESGGLNLYGFVGNNPVNFVDPWGLAVFVGQHPAFVDNPRNPFNHAAIVLRPNNPEAFANHPLFAATGGREATLGGQAFGEGWGFFGRLRSMPNYPGDNSAGLSDMTEVPCPSGQDDTTFINNLLATMSAYQNAALYDPFPDPWGLTYNSNSYVAGLLRAVGATPPNLPGLRPGYNRPLPLHFSPSQVAP